METVMVDLGVISYPIYIGANILEDLGIYLKKLIPARKAMVVTNPTVGNLYGDKVLKSLNNSLFEVVWGEIPEGEQFKSLETASKLYDLAFDSKLDRKSVIIALGGGIVGDLAGFVAATYMRGVPYVQVPTTLLAQVDSSVGGKVAVNHPGGKNIIGAFYQPKMVFADTETLKSLPEREFRAGMAEVIKYGVIWDSEFFEYLKNNIKAIYSLKPEILMHIVKTCCMIKGQVVEKDEKEEGLRAILNYGHTFGHAYEALTGYKKYLHGEAIAVGMVSAAFLAVKLGLLKEEKAQEIKDLISEMGLPVSFGDLPVKEIIKKMYHDKKVKGGKIHFVIPVSIGKVKILTDVPEEKIVAALEEQV